MNECMRYELDKRKKAESDPASILVLLMVVLSGLRVSHPFGVTHPVLYFLMLFFRPVDFRWSGIFFNFCRFTFLSH